MKRSENKKSGGYCFLCVLSAILLALGFGGYFAADWYVRTYGNTGFDSILFTLTGGLNGVQSDLVTSYMLGGFLPAVLSTIVLQIFLFFPQDVAALKCNLFGKKRTLSPCIGSLPSFCLSSSLLVCWDSPVKR